MGDLSEIMNTYGFKRYGAGNNQDPNNYSNPNTLSTAAMVAATATATATATASVVALQERQEMNQYGQVSLKHALLACFSWLQQWLEPLERLTVFYFVIPCVILCKELHPVK